MTAFTEITKKVSILAIETVARDNNYDLQNTFDALLAKGLDDETLGFWVWHIPNNVELYSPKFRKSLGYEGEHDFPSVPQSWKDAISKKDLDIAVLNFKKHVDSKGLSPYDQVVTYNKKNGGTLTVLCTGKIIYWEDGKPILIVGVHMDAARHDNRKWWQKILNINK
jgi:two-component system CheB/CheR fusion protein